MALSTSLRAFTLRFKKMEYMCEVMDEFINSMGRIFSQYVCILVHHVVHSKFITILSVKERDNKMGKQKVPSLLSPSLMMLYPYY